MGQRRNGVLSMTDYEKLMGRLRNRAQGERDDHEALCYAGDMREAATIIETLTRELAEAKRSEEYSESLMRDWRRIANAMGYEPSALEEDKPLPKWLSDRVAMFRQKVVDEASIILRTELSEAHMEIERLKADHESYCKSYDIRAELTDTKARLGEVTHWALRAFTIIEWCCGEGFLFSGDVCDCDDALCDGVDLLGVETATEAQSCLSAIAKQES